MTLIIKELVIRGIVTNDSSIINETALGKEELLQYLEQMKKELERDCVEKAVQKLEAKTNR